MNTILKIFGHLKNFGDYVVEEGALRTGYSDLFVLLTLIALGSLAALLAERIFG